MSDQELLQSQLLALAEGARAIEIRDYEDQPLAVLVKGLFPRVKELLRAATAISEHILETCEGAAEEAAVPAGGGQRFYQAVDSVMAGGTCPATAVADLAFMARFELRSRREQLERLAASCVDRDGGATAVTAEDLVPELLALTGGAQRKVLKTATALENALSKAAGLEAQLDYKTEVEISLQVRRAYAKLRRVVAGGGAPGGGEVLNRLRSCGTAIARLVGRDAYWHLRYQDRLELRHLQHRILTVVTEPEETGELAGRRLWQDLVGFVQLLSAINHRSELEEHDRELIEQAWAELFSTQSPPPRIPEETFVRLADLYGRDEDLDRLIGAKHLESAEAWRVPLARLRARLRPEMGADSRITDPRLAGSQLAGSQLADSQLADSQLDDCRFTPTQGFKEKEENECSINR